MSPLLLVLCAAPVDARFLLTIADAPWAELRVRREGARYRYRATHFLEEGDRGFEKTLALDPAGLVDGRQPEVLALLTTPAPGCREVLEERRGAIEVLCVDAREGGAVRGRLDGVPFSARYERGRLAGLELPGARWERVAAPPRRQAAREEPFAEGFAVVGRGPVLALSPALAGVRVVEVRPSGRPGEVGRARCLVLARDAAERGPGRAVVLGLVIEGGRAFPHAWVRGGEGDEDPSRLPGDQPGRYLDLPPGSAGRVYLELLDGARAVVRGG